MAGEVQKEVSAVLTRRRYFDAEARFKLFYAHIVKEDLVFRSQSVRRYKELIAEILALKLSGDIPPGKKSGDRYGLTEKVVANAPAELIEQTKSRIEELTKQEDVIKDLIKSLSE